MENGHVRARPMHYHRHLLLLPQRPLDIALRITLRIGFALVVLLLPFTDAEQQLGVTIANINFNGTNV